MNTNPRKPISLERAQFQEPVNLSDIAALIDVAFEAPEMPTREEEACHHEIRDLVLRIAEIGVELQQRAKAAA